MKLAINRVVQAGDFARQIKPAVSGFASNGYGRRFSKQDSHPLWKQAFSFFGLDPAQVEPHFKIFTGNHFLDGAYTHLHTDPTMPGYTHTRCNVMLKKPLNGGNPVIDGEEIDVKEGDLWIVFASREQHGSTPISGGERVIFSFGGLVSNEQVEQIFREPEHVR